MNLIYLALGGVIGTLARYACTAGMQSWLGYTFPYGTLTVNMIGSLLIGMVLGATEHFAMAPQWRLFLFVGLFGSFTTFSSFTLETMNLIRAGDLKAAFIYVLASNVLGLIMVFGGHSAARWMAGEA